MFSSAKAVQVERIIKDEIEAMQSLPNTPNEKRIKTISGCNQPLFIFQKFYYINHLNLLSQDNDNL